MAPERGLVGALVDWVNTFPANNLKISSLADLSDGDVLSKILYDIDPYYFRTILQADQHVPNDGDSHWVLRFHRLKRIHKELSGYYTEALGNRLPSNAPNLTQIAKESSKDDIVKLMKIVVAAAVQSDRREEYIKRIQGLSASSQTELMAAITQMMQLEEDEDDEDAEDASTGGDSEFKAEEEMAKLLKEKQASDAKARELQKRLERLQISFEENQQQLSLLQDQLSGTPVGDGGYGGSDPMLRVQLDQLQGEIQKLEDVIAEKENTINQNETTISSLNRKLDDLLPKAEMAEKYKDELDEAIHTIDKLKKSQNVAEKYRRKLEGMAEMEKQIKELEEQNSSAVQQIRQNEELSKQVPGLKKLVDSYKKTIDKVEAENADLIRSKQKLEFDFEKLRERSTGVEMQRSKDMEQIQTLEEKIRDLETGVIRKVAEEQSGGDLDAELTFTTKTKIDLKLQIGRLEAEIAHLKEGGGVNADNVLLKNLLDDSRKAKERLEAEYIQTHSEKLVLESQLNALRGGVSIEGSEVLLKLRETLVARERELTDVKKKLTELEAMHAQTNRELVTAKSDLSMIGKDKLDALEELKARNSTELVALQAEYKDLLEKNKTLSIDLDQHKSLLNKALLEKDDIAKRLTDQQDSILENERSASELKTTLAALEGTAEGRGVELEKRVLQLQNKLEDHREKMVKAREFIKKQNSTISELKTELEDVKTKDADARLQELAEKKAAADAEHEAENARLKRELRLMASAWCDLSSRMQSNTVVLARKSEPSNSWLNRQRSAVQVGNLRR